MTGPITSPSSRRAAFAWWERTGLPNADMDFKRVSAADVPDASDVLLSANGLLSRLAEALARLEALEEENAHLADALVRSRADLAAVMRRLQQPPQDRGKGSK